MIQLAVLKKLSFSNKYFLNYGRKPERLLFSKFIIGLSSEAALEI